jgi:hypothetical protein
MFVRPTEPHDLVLDGFSLKPFLITAKLNFVEIGRQFAKVPNTILFAIFGFIWLLLKNGTGKCEPAPSDN